MNGANPSQPRWTWFALLVILLLCLGYGLWVTRGLTSPAILDTFRDAGFVQGIVDGNWFGDPNLAGAWRYYPPLIHALFAAVCALTGAAPLPLLIHTAPFVNLAVPAGFFFMSRSLTGAPAATLGTALLVLWNGTALPAWITAAYHPWSSVPLLALGLFFFGAWCIHARLRLLTWSNAVVAGSVIGLVFLAHTVPAVILAAMLPVAILVRHGPRVRTWGWLCLAGIVAMIWSLPLLWPLLASYHLHVRNAIPGGFVDPLFAGWPPRRGMMVTLLPGLLALPVVSLLRSEAAVSREAAAMLAVWLILPALFLSRHYVCEVGSTAATCTVFVVAVHHWFIYFQAALTCVAGLAAWRCMLRVDRAFVRSRRFGARRFGARRFGAAALVVIALVAVMASWLRPTDRDMRERAQDIAGVFDWNSYSWIARHTSPRALFVTELPAESLNPASLAVMAAGRSSVALPSTYSNPYVDWETRARQNAVYLAAAHAPPLQADPVLCELRHSASGANAYVILPNDRSVATTSLQREAMGPVDTIYGALPLGCGNI